jgi:hypothetical protein
VEEFEDGLKKNKNILVYFEKKKNRSRKNMKKRD